MVGILVGEKTTKVILVGHGLTLRDRFELAPGIFTEPAVPNIDLQVAAETSHHFRDYASVVSGMGLASFCIEVTADTGGKALAVKAWNALWLFHLLSLACAAPCFSLYAISQGDSIHYSSINRNFAIRPMPALTTATLIKLRWAKEHYNAFNSLIVQQEFGTSMRCYGNSHYLFDLDLRIMLLWSGIEGLLSVDSELNRRLALYVALMLDGTADEKLGYFTLVKKAYSTRSQAVHGGNLAPKKLKEGYQIACEILVRLLARCVELGRVPSTAELDALAISQTIR